MKTQSDKYQTLSLAFILAVPKLFRGKELVSQLKNSNFECRIIPGIDGTSLTSEAVSKMINQRASQVLIRRNISKGEACCVQVHLEAYKEFLRTSNEWVLILEDDIALSRPEIFHPVFSIESEKPMILKLSTLPNDLLYPMHSNSPQDDLIFNIGFQKIRFPTNNADAYFINRSAALIALESSHGFIPHYTADWPYLWDNKVQFWTSKFKHAGQTGNSLIDESLERSHLAAGKKVRRTLIKKIIQNTKDILFITSIKLELTGGNGPQFYKSRVMPKLHLWLIRFRDNLKREA